MFARMKKVVKEEKSAAIQLAAEEKAKHDKAEFEKHKAAAIKRAAKEKAKRDKRQSEFEKEKAEARAHFKMEMRKLEAKKDAATIEWLTSEGYDEFEIAQLKHEGYVFLDDKEETKSVVQKSKGILNKNARDLLTAWSPSPIETKEEPAPCLISDPDEITLVDIPAASEEKEEDVELIPWQTLKATLRGRLFWAEGDTGLLDDYLRDKKGVPPTNDQKHTSDFRNEWKEENEKVAVAKQQVYAEREKLADHYRNEGVLFNDMAMDFAMLHQALHGITPGAAAAAAIAPDEGTYEPPQSIVVATLKPLGSR